MDLYKLGTNRAGNISLSTLKAKVSSLQNAALFYILGFKQINYIDQIKRDKFENFSSWRMNQVFKHINKSFGRTIIPKDSTVKRDIVNPSEWFNNFLKPCVYIDFTLSFEILNKGKMLQM